MLLIILRLQEVLRKIYITYAFDRTLMPQEKLVGMLATNVI